MAGRFDPGGRRTLPGTAKRSDLVRWANYGYCASHSRYFWGLRLQLICTASGLPVAFALASAKEDERTVALDMITIGDLARLGQIVIADKGYRSAEFERVLHDAGIMLIRPETKTEVPRPGHQFLKPFRQIIDSVNQPDHSPRTTTDPFEPIL